MTATVADVRDLLEGLEKLGDFYLMVKPAALQLETGQILVRGAASSEVVINLVPGAFTLAEEIRRVIHGYVDAGLCLVQGLWPTLPEGYEWVQHSRSGSVELFLTRREELSPGAVLHRTQTFTKRSLRLLGATPLRHSSWGAVGNHISHHQDPDSALRGLYA